MKQTVAASSSAGPPAWRRWLFRCGWQCSRWGCGWLRWLLWPLAALQAVIVFFLVAGWDFPVPREVVDYVDQQVATQGLSVTWAEARFDLAGRLRVRGLQVSDRTTREPWLSADRATLLISTSALLVGRLEVERVRVELLNFHRPALHSPAGLNEVMAELFSAEITRQGPRWHLHHATIVWRGARVHAHGVLQLPPRRADAPSAAPLAVVPLFHQIARLGTAVEPWLDRAEGPTAELQFSPIGADNTRMDAILRVPRYDAPAEVTVTGIEVALPGLELFPARPALPVSVRVDEVRWQNGSQPVVGEGGRLQLHVPQLSLAGLAHAGDVRLSLARLTGYDESLEPVWLTVRPQAYPELTAEVELRHRGRPLRAAVQADVEQRSGQVRLESRLDAMAILNHPAVPAQRIRHYFDFPVPPEAVVEADFGPGFQLREARFAGEVREGSIRGFPVRRGGGGGVFRDGRLTVPHFFVDNPDYRMEGRYEENVAARSYRLWVEGTANPLDLNGMMGPWWPQLWDYFRLSAPIGADLHVNGFWDGKGDSYAEGSIALRDFSFRGLPLNFVTAYLRAGPRHTQLAQLNARREAHRLRGQVDLFLRPRVAGNYTALLDLESAFPLLDLAQVAGPETVTILSEFDVPTPPVVQVQGWFGQSAPAPSPLRRDLRFRTSTTQNLRWRGIPLEGMTMAVRVSDTAVEVPELRFGFAGGRGEGALNFRNLPLPPRLSIDLDVQGARYPALMYVIQNFPASGLLRPRETAIVDTKALADNPALAGLQEAAPGTMDLRFRLQGETGKIETFVGDGGFAVQEAELGRFHMLGAVSKVLAGAGLGVSSLSLDRGSGQIRVDRGVVDFLALRFEGPTHGLDAAGTLRYPGKELDFRGYVRLLDTTSVPIVEWLGPILRPLGGLLSVRLTGTLAEPKVGLELFGRGGASGPRSLVPPDPARVQPPLLLPTPLPAPSGPPSGGAPVIPGEASAPAATGSLAPRPATGQARQL